MILIFGGTTEGRMAASTIMEAGKKFFYSTRTEGQEISLPEGAHLCGTMDAASIVCFCHKNDIRLIVDAAHPFATGLHSSVADASEKLGIPVIRLERLYPSRSDNMVFCSSWENAVDRLEKDGVERLLALTGVQTIGRLKPFWKRHCTVFRILDRDDSRGKAAAEGFPLSHVVYYSGSEDDLMELIRNVRPDAVLTKESGKSGGFEEKQRACDACGAPMYVISRPELPGGFVTVYGEYGLREAIQTLLPGYYELNVGLTTGSCATAAACAATNLLLTGKTSDSVTFLLPSGEPVDMSLESSRIEAGKAAVTVVKHSGDDPDVTDGCLITATVSFSREPGIHIAGGEGVGIVTLPGLGLPVGEAAINQTPRRMIKDQLSSMTDRGLDVCISVENGEELAQHTFNGRVGVVGGISIIGSSGVVRPFSHEAFIDAIRREFEVAMASGTERVVINSGAKSEKAVKMMYPDLPQQAFIHYGNAIGETLAIASEMRIPRLTMGVMIGKAVKLAEGHLDTHSHKVTFNKDFLVSIAVDAGCSDSVIRMVEEIDLARDLWRMEDLDTAPHFFSLLVDKVSAVCRAAYDNGDLEILLIRDDGSIANRLDI